MKQILLITYKKIFIQYPKHKYRKMSFIRKMKTLKLRRNTQNFSIATHLFYKNEASATINPLKRICLSSSIKLLCLQQSAKFLG